MTKRRLTLPAGLLVCALTIPGTAFAAAADDPYPQHSSDGVRGPIARDLPAYARSAAPRSTTPTGYTVAPGVTYSTWSETDARGPIKAHLLRINYQQPGLRLNYANPGRIASTQRVRGMLDKKAVAGVNGDFFDIGDSGAPFGIGQERAKGFLHGPSPSWSAGFTISKSGQPFIGPIQVRARIKQYRDWPLTNVNSPSVPDGGIGIYNARWGSTPGYGVTDGQKSRIVQVQVVNGKVVRKKARLRAGHRIKGFLLVGRGSGARLLRQLQFGDRISVARGVTGRPGMAITSNSFLLRNGLRTVTDDGQMHPRTAIGISHDTSEILMLVVDGRQAASRGYTMVELAEMMLRLGAEDALNLDGGGSSTMVARRPGGTNRVLNTPSDGRPRSVANAIQVLYSAPR
ncbi:phosphodiester glycosidase family protein [Nocardioides sp. W7]|uniref:phosphodiester glycosidase family protein n=1 Tax=Nocardioides sp. W7 TaxID=2931390 RepID=UPI001FD22295|nr:phosphodiester glycosidase family protein [Nocardioides sp. W7]